jgi:hypothetical protein
VTGEHATILVVDKCVAALTARLASWCAGLATTRDGRLAVASADRRNPGNHGSFGKKK